MTPPPTSIDGTDITGATIDGQDVQEITVDGQTVFTAVPSNLPVGYSDLIAWYPFDSAEYGGSNADDVTGIIGDSGDDTPHDATVLGATYQSNGGVTDINAGANSGAFDFDGQDDQILNTSINNPSYLGTFDWGVSLVFKADTSNGEGLMFIAENRQSGGQSRLGIRYRDGQNILAQTTDDSFTTRSSLDSGTTFSTGQFVHVVFTTDGSGNQSLYAREEGFSGNTLVDTESFSVDLRVESIRIGAEISAGSLVNNFDGIIEDVRFYKKELSFTDVDKIYQNIMP